MDTVLPSTRPPGRTAARSMTVLVCGRTASSGGTVRAARSRRPSCCAACVRRPAVRRRDRLREGRRPGRVARAAGRRRRGDQCGRHPCRSARRDARRRASRRAVRALHRVLPRRRAARDPDLGARRRAWRYALLREQVRSRPLPADAADRLPDRASRARLRHGRRVGAVFPDAREPAGAGPAGGRPSAAAPVHVDDLAEVVARCVDVPAAGHPVIDVVGADEVEYREMLARYRAALGFAPAVRIGLPRWPVWRPCCSARCRRDLHPRHVDDAAWREHRRSGRRHGDAWPAAARDRRLHRRGSRRAASRCARDVASPAVARRAGDRVDLDGHRQRVHPSAAREPRAACTRAPDGCPRCSRSTRPARWTSRSASRPSSRRHAARVAQAALIVAYSAVIAVTMPACSPNRSAPCSRTCRFSPSC